jgi:hypothetical protein
MENTFFISGKEKIKIDRFHICSWEFNDNQSLLEFGSEINTSSLVGKDRVILFFFIPWLTKDYQIIDLYTQLCQTTNSRFIFNDSVNGIDSLDGGVNEAGIIHKFDDRDPLCILPISTSIELNNQLVIDIDLKAYSQYTKGKPNIYFRFCIKTKSMPLSTRTLGINKSTVIYDIKVNEKRNIPVNRTAEFKGKEFCEIDNCFCFNILPNSYDMVFADASLKNVRTLEHNSFSQYLGGIIEIPKDELMVVFNKKATNFIFFSIYSQERIGTAQFASAILINIICGILLFIPSWRKSFNPKMTLGKVWLNLPIEIYISFIIALITLCYFMWPTIKGNIKLVFNKNKK